MDSAASPSRTFSLSHQHHPYPQQCHIYCPFPTCLPEFPLLCSARPCCGEKEKVGGHKASPSLCLTARDRTRTKQLPTRPQPAPKHLAERRGGQQGPTAGSGTGSGDGDSYLRNGTSEPLEEGGGLPSLSSTLGPCPSLGTLSIRFIFCHPSMRTTAEREEMRINYHQACFLPETPRQSSCLYPEIQTEARLPPVVFLTTCLL